MQCVICVLSRDLDGPTLHSKFTVAQNARLAH